MRRRGGQTRLARRICGSGSQFLIERLLPRANYEIVGAPFHGCDPFCKALQLSAMDEISVALSAYKSLYTCGEKSGNAVQHTAKILQSNSLFVIELRLIAKQCNNRQNAVLDLEIRCSIH